MAQLPPDPASYGSAQRPVRQDMFQYIIEVGWPGGGWALVEMPTTAPNFGPLGCYLVPLAASGASFFPGAFGGYSPNGKFYTRGQLIPKNDYAGPIVTTTAVLSGTALSSLGSIGGPHVAESLHAGISYFITGPGIPPNAFFTFDGMHGGTLSAPAAPSPLPVPVKISNWVFRPLNLDLNWISPPVSFDYASRGIGFANSGYWGDIAPDGFPLGRVDAIADVEDISLGVADPGDWIGPALVDYFNPALASADEFFGNWFEHDDTVGGPHPAGTPNTGPTRANWNIGWYFLTWFADDSTTLDYMGWHLQSDVGGFRVPFTLANSGDSAPSDVTRVNIWQFRFPTAAWSYQYLVDMSKVRELAIMQLSTQFRSRNINLAERIPGFGGVTVRMFSGGVQFFLDGAGRLNPVTVDPATGSTMAAVERWSRTYGLASSLSVDTEIGRFNKSGPT